MPKVPYPYEVNGKLVTGNGSLIPMCSLSNRSLLPSLTIHIFTLLQKSTNPHKEGTWYFVYVRLYFCLPFYVFIIMQTKHQIFGSHLRAAKRTKYQKVLNWKKLNHDSQGSIHILRRGKGGLEKKIFFVYFQYLKYGYIERSCPVLYTVCL